MASPYIHVVLGGPARTGYSAQPHSSSFGRCCWRQNPSCVTLPPLQKYADDSQIYVCTTVNEAPPAVQRFTVESCTGTTIYPHPHPSPHRQLPSPSPLPYITSLSRSPFHPRTNLLSSPSHYRTLKHLNTKRFSVFFSYKTRCLGSGFRSPGPQNSNI